LNKHLLYDKIAPI